MSMSQNGVTDQQARNVIQSVATPRNIAIAGVGIVAAGALVTRGLTDTNLTALDLTTEQATSAFAIMAGVGGAAGQLLAANRLSGIDNETVPLTSLLLPVGVAIGGSVVATRFLPGD